MEIAQRIETALEALYHPQGYNLGMNIGRAPGAGIADHLHMHVLPRWIGDTNFMTTTGETRVEPEELEVTYTNGCARRWRHKPARGHGSKREPGADGRTKLLRADGSGISPRAR